MAEYTSVVLGYGPVGRALTTRLIEHDRPVRVVTRSGTATVPDGVDHRAADVADTEAMAKACAGADVIYGCVGLTYEGWPEKWPPMMAGMLAGAEAAGARFVFMDNCYMYGPVDAPMTEDLPLTDYGRKPATRSEITRMWQGAHTAGRVEAAAVRASDFYGPGVIASILGELSVGRLAAGRPARLVGDPDQPHSVSYVPDVARALMTVGDADDAMGEAWNVPNCPDETMRQIMARFADEFGAPLRIRKLPKSLLTIAGIVSVNAREMKEMLYQWEQPFRVDSSKFGARFWSDATPLDIGVKATVDASRS